MVNFKSLGTSLACTGNKILYFSKKNSPQLLMGSGCLALGAGFVMAFTAGNRVSKDIDTAKRDLDEIHSDRETMSEEDFTPADYKHEIVGVYKATGKSIIKDAGPAVVTFGTGMAAVITGGVILHKRNKDLEKSNAGLIAACSSIGSMFAKYRENVVEKYGAEEDFKLRYGIKDVEVEETVVDNKGKEKVVKKKIEAVDGLDGYSEFARFFDEGCFEWTKSPEYNLTFLRQVRNDMQRRLEAKGILFLNEVYEALGIPLTEAGQEVGWVYDLNNPNFNNEIDFGIYNINRARNRDFVNGYENVILLDFNVDGPVKQYIPRYYRAK